MLIMCFHYNEYETLIRIMSNDREKGKVCCCTTLGSCVAGLLRLATKKPLTTEGNAERKVFHSLNDAERFGR